MPESPERALQGAEDIAACVETWWRLERNKRGVRVSRRTVIRWIRRLGFPAERVGDGPWVSTPSEVFLWLRRHFVTSTGGGHDVPGVPNAH